MIRRGETRLRAPSSSRLSSLGLGSLMAGGRLYHHDDASHLRPAPHSKASTEMVAGVELATFAAVRNLNFDSRVTDVEEDEEEEEEEDEEDFDDEEEEEECEDEEMMAAAAKRFK